MLKRALKLYRHYFHSIKVTVSPVNWGSFLEVSLLLRTWISPAFYLYFFINYNCNKTFLKSQRSFVRIKEQQTVKTAKKINTQKNINFQIKFKQWNIKQHTLWSRQYPQQGTQQINKRIRELVPVQKYISKNKWNQKKILILSASTWVSKRRIIKDNKTRNIENSH